MGEFRRIGEWFVHKGILSPEQLEHATGLQRDSKRRLGEILLSCGYVTESDVTDCLAAQYYMQVADLATVRSKPDARRLIPASFALSHLVLPLKVDDQSFECVIDDPVDLPFLDGLQQKAGKRLVLTLAPRTALFEAICKAYHLTNMPGVRCEGIDVQPKRKRKPVKPQIDRSRLLDLLVENY
jgi:type IV pilus assembly protein PilB